MRAPGVAASLIIAACQADPPAPAPQLAEPQLAATLDFGDVAIGMERVLPTSAPGITTEELEAPPPFFVLPPAPLHPGTSPRVAFRPVGSGLVEKELIFRRDALTVRVHLRGNGRPPADCLPSACQREIDAPDRLSCTLATVPDGTACADRCVDHGTCRGGACEGASRDCDDHRACTADSCEPRAGCVHRLACPGSPNACIDAVCLADGTCGLHDRADGVTCGATDADVTHRCRSVTCREEPAWSPATDCEAETPPPLAPVWRRSAAFDAPLAVDAHGRIATLACGSDRCSLVALDVDGRERGRAELGQGHRESAVMAMNGLYVAAVRDAVQAFDAETLAPVWSHSVAGQFGNRTHGAVAAMARASSTAVAVLVADEGDDLPQGADPVDGALVRLDAATGTVLLSESAPREYQLASNGAETLVSMSWGNVRDDVVGRTPGGSWRVFDASSQALVVAGDTLLRPGATTARALDSGLPRYEHPRLAAAVSSGDLAWGWFSADGKRAETLTALDLHGGTPVASCTLRRMVRLFATSRESVLAMFGGFPGPVVAREFFATGETRSIGTLEDGVFVTDASVSNDRLLVVTHPPHGPSTLSAYPLPAGLALAPHGWVMDGGNPSRDFTPR